MIAWRRSSSVSARAKAFFAFEAEMNHQFSASPFCALLKRLSEKDQHLGRNSMYSDVFFHLQEEDDDENSTSAGRLCLVLIATVAKQSQAGIRHNCLTPIVVSN